MDCNSSGVWAVLFPTLKEYPFSNWERENGLRDRATRKFFVEISGPSGSGKLDSVQQVIVITDNTRIAYLSCALNKFIIWVMLNFRAQRYNETRGLKR